MDIGIIGSGNMGRALGVRLALAGHAVLFGSRKKEPAEAAAEIAGHGARAGSNDEAARFGAALIWTIRDPDPAKVLSDPSLLDGKLVIDLNNRDYANEVATGGWFQEAIAEQRQAKAPQARVVKAFNTLAMEAFDIPTEALRRVGAQTFLAGADQAARATAGEIARSIGLEPVDLGEGAAALRACEALGDAIRLAMIDGKKGWRAHLRLIELPDEALGAIGERAESGYK